MSEEEVKLVEDKSEEKVEEVIASPTEVTAREQGWVSKEEWEADGKDGDAWRPAKEFVDRGELYKSIHSTKRELKQTQAALGALQKHHAFVFEKAQKAALEELKREKRVAIKNEDFQKLEEVEEDIEKLTEQQQAEKQEFTKEQQAVAVQTQGIHPDFQAWQEENTWYTKDEDLREYADFKGIKYTQKNPGVDPRTVLEYVTKEVKKQFPDKFGVRKAAPNAVLGVNKQNSGNRKVVADDDLTETEMDIMKELVSSGTMTEKQYRAELKKYKDK